MIESIMVQIKDICNFLKENPADIYVLILCVFVVFMIVSTLFII